jgi:hypothetical protein
MSCDCARRTYADLMCTFPEILVIDTKLTIMDGARLLDLMNLTLHSAVGCTGTMRAVVAEGSRLLRHAKFLFG